ncbi:MAG: sulfite exporter TauE/SafE family protein [Rhizobiaceae bacterium]
MTIEFIAILSAGAFLGAFINGLAGFGTALFTLGFWLQIMPPIQAVSLSLALAIISGFPGLKVIWNSIDFKLLLRFLLPAFVGIPVGTYLLLIVSAETMTLLVAIFLFVYGAYFSLRAALPSMQNDHPTADRFIGFLGGILGGMAGLSGALPTMWLSMRDWAKSKIRGILQPFNSIILFLAAIGAAYHGGYNWETLEVMAMAAPASIVGTFAGIKLFKYVNDQIFRRMLIVIMLLSGCSLLLKIFVFSN